MPESSPVTEQQQPLLTHLNELRSRLLWMLGSMGICFVALLPFARPLFSLAAAPLLSKMPAGTLIATQVAAPFLIPLKLVMFLAFLLALPVVLYHLWAFIAPGLYQQERRWVFPLLITSVLLFYLGAAFAYFVVLPIVFGFFVSIAPEGVAVMTDIDHYLKFIFLMFFGFGMAFEIPVAMLLMVRAGVVTPAALRAKRAYILLGAFVVGMLLTPPDAISQTLLAVPVYILYELGLLLSGWFVPGARQVEQQQAQLQADKHNDSTT